MTTPNFELSEDDINIVKEFEQSLLDKKLKNYYHNRIEKILKQKGILPFHVKTVSGAIEDYLYYDINDTCDIPSIGRTININIFTSSIYTSNDNLIESVNAYYVVPYYAYLQDVEDFLPELSEKCDKILEKVKKFKSLNI